MSLPRGFNVEQSTYANKPSVIVTQKPRVQPLTFLGEMFSLPLPYIHFVIKNNGKHFDEPWAIELVAFTNASLRRYKPTTIIYPGAFPNILNTGTPCLAKQFTASYEEHIEKFWLENFNLDTYKFLEKKSFQSLLRLLHRDAANMRVYREPDIIAAVVNEWEKLSLDDIMTIQWNQGSPIEWGTRRERLLT